MTQTNHKTPNAGTSGAYTGEKPNADDTTSTSAAKLPEALLRGLFTYPAQRVVTLCEDLEVKDFHAEQHRVIYRFLREHAYRLVHDGDGEHAVSPVAVQLDLQEEGYLNSSATQDALLAVSLGNPPAPTEMQRLATGLKQQRLRRGFDTASSMFNSAARGSSQNMARCLHWLPALFDLARRAGVTDTVREEEVSSQHRQTTHAEMARRYEAAGRMEPNAEGYRDTLRARTDAPAARRVQAIGRGR